MSEIEQENEHVYTLGFQEIVSSDRFLLPMYPTPATHSWKGWVKFHQFEGSLLAQAPLTQLLAWFYTRMGIIRHGVDYLKSQEDRNNLDKILDLIYIFRAEKIMLKKIFLNIISIFKVRMKVEHAQEKQSLGRG